MSDRVPTYDTQDRGGFGPDDRRPAAGVSRVAVVILVEPTDQDPAHPTGLTHIACNNLGSALEGAGFELAGGPGRHEIAPVPAAAPTTLLGELARRQGLVLSGPADPLGAAVAARDLAIDQRERLRECMAGLVDATGRIARAAADRADLGESDAYAALERAADAAGRLLLDLPHRDRDPDVRRHLAETFPVKSCGAVAPHPPHVLGTIQDPHQCRGYGGFD